MYGTMPFQPYGYQQFQPQLYAQQSANTPPSPAGMEVVPVATLQQVEQIGIQPGQRKMVLVQNEPVIAARSADNMGLVTTEYYRLVKFVPGSGEAQHMDNYVTRKEFDDFVASIQPGKARKESQ